jgi:hypothetical protein
MPDTDEPRELLLSSPVGGSLWLRNKDGSDQPLPDAFITVQSPDILAISGRYTPEADGAEAVLSSKSAQPLFSLKAPSHLALPFSAFN